MVWAVRPGWLGLAFTCGPPLATALDGGGGLIPAVGAIVLWTAWAAGLVASLLPSPLSLTLLRMGAPAAMAAVGAAAVAGPAATAPFALAWSVGLTALVMAPAVGRHHVNGPAYPNELRLPLRPPGAVLLGPVYLAWIAAVPLPAAGLLLLADGRIIGAPLLVAGGLGMVLGGRALLQLARRWLVFVPAGIVLHDHLALADPVLFPKKQIRTVAAATAASSPRDLTLGAPGLPLEISFKEEADLGKLRRGRGLGDVVRAGAVLVSPTRPGEVVREAGARGIGIAKELGPRR